MSAYLDDLSPAPGDAVQCKASITLPFWTPGKTYVVQKDGGLIDDTGAHVTHPGARFEVNDAKAA